MKLAISNIAWPVEEQDRFLKLIKKLGCSGVEIAPSLIWPDPVGSTSVERKKFKALIESYGLEIPAIQALLFGREDLGLFRDEAAGRKTADYLKGLCRLAADIGAQVLVFGSPANRKRGNLSMDESFDRASKLLSGVGQTATDLGVYFCIEPLRRSETDFISTVDEGLRLVDMIDQKGFALHLDGKAVSEEGGDFKKLFKRALPRLRHFHINEPELAEVDTTGEVKHKQMAQALKEVGYSRYASIEMRRWPDHENVIERSLRFASQTYIQ